MASQGQGSTFGLLFQYPQGQVSFLPTIIALSALVCNYLMFLPFRGDDEKPFMCLPTNHTNYSPSLRFQCPQLRLVDTSYWSDSGNLDEGQGGKIQAAAFMGIVATIGAAYAFMTLASAMCFNLNGRRICSVFVVQVCSAVFSLLSIFIFMLVNFCADENKSDVSFSRGEPSSSSSTSTCSRLRPRLEHGAVAAISACIFHLAGCMTVWWYRREAIRQVNTATLPKYETAPLNVNENGRMQQEA